MYAKPVGVLEIWNHFLVASSLDNQPWNCLCSTLSLSTQKVELLGLSILKIQKMLKVWRHVQAKPVSVLEIWIHPWLASSIDYLSWKKIRPGPMQSTSKIGFGGGSAFYLVPTLHRHKTGLCWLVFNPNFLKLWQFTYLMRVFNPCNGELIR